MSLADATAKAVLMRAEARTTGIAPQRRRGVPFGEVVRDYLAAIDGAFVPRTLEIKRYVLEGPPMKPLRRVPVNDLTTDHFRRAAKAQKAPTTAYRVVKEGGVVLAWAMEQGEYGLDRKVARAAKIPSGSKRRDRALSDAEIVSLWRGTAAPTRGNIALRLLLLTGQRSRELRLAKWADIDANGVWHVRNRKGTKEPNLVPLSSLALVEVERTRRFDSVYLFPARKRGADPTKDGPFRQQVYRLVRRTGMDPWAPHDLRRTLRSRLAELGVDAVLAEKILGHRLNGVWGSTTFPRRSRRSAKPWRRSPNTSWPLCAVRR